MFLKRGAEFLGDPVDILRSLCGKGPSAEMLDIGLGVVWHPYFSPTKTFAREYGVVGSA